MDKLTLLPGESSTRSRSGTPSFTATNAGLVVRRVRLPTGDEATKRARDLRVELVMRCIILAVKVEEQTGGDDDERDCLLISQGAVVSDGEVRGAMVVWHRDNSFVAPPKRDSGMQVNDSLTRPGLESAAKRRQLSAAGRELRPCDR